MELTHEKADEIYGLAGDIARMRAAREMVRECAIISLTKEEARTIVVAMDKAMDRLRIAWETIADEAT